VLTWGLAQQQCQVRVFWCEGGSGAVLAQLQGVDMHRAQQQVQWARSSSARGGGK
jgi:hypothetical protein